MITSAVLTPPQIARQYGIAPEKVVAFIKSGELRAFNLAKKPGGRPRYKIAMEDLLAFLECRRVQARPRVKPRKKKQSEVIQFF
jgi:hypothetical protein